MPTWLIIVVTFILTYTLSLVVRVLTSREKKVNYESDLGRDRDSKRGKSKIGRDQAKHASREAWERVGSNADEEEDTRE